MCYIFYNRKQNHSCVTAANLLLAVAVIVVAGAIDCRNTDNDVNEIFERAKEDAVKMIVAILQPHRLDTVRGVQYRSVFCRDWYPSWVFR